jgi:superfamily II DNA or RNA helicase
MIGFSATPKGRGGNTDMKVEAMFGPIIASYTYEEAVELNAVVPIEVRIVKVKGMDYTYNDPTALNRHGLWRNTVRNQKIKEVSNWLDAEGVTKQLIMTGTAEHAYNIKRYLPEFTVVHSDLPEERKDFLVSRKLLDINEADIDTDEIKRKFENDELTKVISTFRWKEGANFPNLGVVIRSDGVSNAIATEQISGRSSRIFEGKTKGIVVDFLDEFGDELFSKSMTRIKQYRKIGWEVNIWDGKTIKKLENLDELFLELPEADTL